MNNVIKSPFTSMGSEWVGKRHQDVKRKPQCSADFSAKGIPNVSGPYLIAVINTMQRAEAKCQVHKPAGEQQEHEPLGPALWCPGEHTCSSFSQAPQLEYSLMYSVSQQSNSRDIFVWRVLYPSSSLSAFKCQHVPYRTAGAGIK